MRMSLDVKEAIRIAVLFFMALFILFVTDGKSVIASDNVIVSFEESGPIDFINISGNVKPGIDELQSEMPESIGVILKDGSSKKIRVSWYPLGDDYEKSDYYYFQFSPRIEESGYSLEKGLDMATDAPYVAVFIGDDESDCSADEISIMSTSDNIKSIYNFCVNDIGINSAATCGILANIRAESNFNPTATGDSGTSYGLCQWHASRWIRMENYCSKNGYDSSTVNGQMNYLNYELKNYYPTVLEYLKGVSNDEDGAYNAGYYFCYHFEIPSNTEAQSQSRGNLAKNTYWKSYGNSEDTGSGITEDDTAPEILYDQDEETAKENNEPYYIKKILAKNVGESSIRLYAAEEVPYRGFKSKSAEDYGVSLSINGVAVPSANIVLKINGNSGYGNSLALSIKSIKGSQYRSILKKLKSTFRNNIWYASQYGMTVSSQSINSKAEAYRTGQIIVKRKKDGITIKNIVAVVFYHTAKGDEKKKTVKIKKGQYSYDSASKTISFNGNLRGSVSLNW